MKKVLLGIAVVVLLVIAGTVWWLYTSLDSVVASAIREYGPQITGVSVRLSSVKILPADGTASLRGLVIGNPKGFNTEHALSLSEISMKLDIASLTKDVVLIKDISIIKPDIAYDYGPSGSNLDVIKHNVDRYVGASLRGTSESKGKSSGKKFIIENLYVKDGKVEVSTEMLKGKTESVSLPDLHLRDIGKKSNGATAGEVTGEVLAAITQSVTKEARSLNLGKTVESVEKSAGSVGGELKGLLK
ncbi:MAG TPA: hypothetical protein VLV32_10110 [Burkholderiales bacterium]|nr:hypothetical protein [Burkholderiales bacterium]